jgi:hypothetical protein
MLLIDGVPIGEHSKGRDRAGKVLGEIGQLTASGRRTAAIRPDTRLQALLLFQVSSPLATPGASIHDDDVAQFGYDRHEPEDYRGNVG